MDHLSYEYLEKQSNVSENIMYSPIDFGDYFGEGCYLENESMVSEKNMDPVKYILEGCYLEKQSTVSTSFGLLKVYGTKMKRLSPENHVQKQSIESERKSIINTGKQCLSAHSIMKLGRERLVELNSKKTDIFAILSGNKSAHLEDTELSIVIQAAAQLFAKKKLVAATKLLRECKCSASKSGSPTQRLVFYFADALQEKIDREWGLISEDSTISRMRKDPIDLLQTMVSLEPSMMDCQQDIPAVIICQFTLIRSLFDSVAAAERVHIVDLSINNGSHWIIFMQELAGLLYSPLQLLKITAIGTSKQIMEDTGERLASIARSMNLPFQFNAVLSEFKDVKEDMFELEDNELVAVFSSVCLWSLLPFPSHLESLMQVLKKLNPCVMVVNEIEASLNSPIFLERFTDALMYIGAVFDSLYVSLENHPFRMLCEEVLLKDMITNLIVAEGQERTQRQEKMKKWKEIFAKYGIDETDLSSSALSQARLLHKHYAYQSHLTVEMDGKALIIGWEGTPLQFVSAWKFQ